ncbi:complex I subunit 5 family protein [Roseococcus microcysteis]|uniref:complex I subunit 5 family protein n=1 Tax=Roseococcus microcysteis TaxID=2771361 RepID=UPI00168ABA90|nr:complex I subunit 5 family protein [Roseococcus microcysteis]
MNLVIGPLLPFVALAWPLLLGLAAAWPAWRMRALWVLPAAPLPALLLAIAWPEGSSTAPALLLGTELVLDAPGRLLLGMVALIWLAAGIFALGYFREPRKPAVFAGFWCLTLSGNLGVMLAADVATFYVAFAAVSLAAYWLVVHDGSAKALAAGRVYLVLALLGEALLLVGLLLGVAAADSLSIAAVAASLSEAPLALTCLILGFGLKAGMVPLHMWLPLAHPAAPTPASAALSGAIVKAGIIGLIRFLPEDTGFWATGLLLLGLIGAYGGVLAGLLQRNAKAVLAYSTISQMGLVLATLGVGTTTEAALYAAHHGFAKAALFLGVGVLAATGRRALPWVLALAALPALSIAGAPLLGGALVKAAIKPGFAGWLEWAVALSATGTALLLARALWLAAQGRAEAEEARPEPLLWAPWAGLILVALALPWLLLAGFSTLTPGYALGLASLWDATWPLLLAALLAAPFLWLRPHVPTLPEGDLIVPLGAAAGVAVHALRRIPEPAAPHLAIPGARRGRVVLAALEAALLPWRRGGLLAAVLVLALAWSLAG